MNNIQKNELIEFFQKDINLLKIVISESTEKVPESLIYYYIDKVFENKDFFLINELIDMDQLIASPASNNLIKRIFNFYKEELKKEKKGSNLFEDIEDKYYRTFEDLLYHFQGKRLKQKSYYLKIKEQIIEILPELPVQIQCNFINQAVYHLLAYNKQRGRVLNSMNYVLSYGNYDQINEIIKDVFNYKYSKTEQIDKAFEYCHQHVLSKNYDLYVKYMEQVCQNPKLSAKHLMTIISYFTKKVSKNNNIRYQQIIEAAKNNPASKKMASAVLSALGH